MKRAAVAHLQAELGLSQRRACRLVGADRKMIRSRTRRPADTELRATLRDLANVRRRFGYPLPTGDWTNRPKRAPVRAAARRWRAFGTNRIYRLYREERLAVHKRRACRKAVGSQAPILVEARPNARALSAIARNRLSV